jgi:hypothetical protein
MKHLFIYLTILSLWVSQGTCSAQTATVSAGGNAIGTGGSVSYSVGQIAYTNNSNSNGSVAQGVQYPYEIQLSLQNLKPSAYILKVIQGKKEIKTFKIIKN